MANSLLPDELWPRVLSCVGVIERCSTAALVCKQFHAAVRASLTHVNMSHLCVGSCVRVVERSYAMNGLVDPRECVSVCENDFHTRAFTIMQSHEGHVCLVARPLARGSMCEEAIQRAASGRARAVRGHTHTQVCVSDHTHTHTHTHVRKDSHTRDDIGASGATADGAHDSNTRGRLSEDLALLQMFAVADAEQAADMERAYPFPSVRSHTHTCAHTRAHTHSYMLPGLRQRYAERAARSQTHAPAGRVAKDATLVWPLQTLASECPDPACGKAVWDALSPVRVCVGVCTCAGAHMHTLVANECYVDAALLQRIAPLVPALARLDIGCLLPHRTVSACGTLAHILTSSFSTLRSLGIAHSDISTNDLSQILRGLPLLEELNAHGAVTTGQWLDGQGTCDWIFTGEASDPREKLVGMDWEQQLVALNACSGGKEPAPGDASTCSGLRRLKRLTLTNVAAGRIHMLLISIARCLPSLECLEIGYHAKDGAVFNLTGSALRAWQLHSLVQRGAAGAAASASPDTYASMTVSARDYDVFADPSVGNDMDNAHAWARSSHFRLDVCPEAWLRIPSADSASLDQQQAIDVIHTHPYGTQPVSHVGESTVESAVHELQADFGLGHNTIRSYLQVCWRAMCARLSSANTDDDGAELPQQISTLLWHISLTSLASSTCARTLGSLRVWGHVPLSSRVVVALVTACPNLRQLQLQSLDEDADIYFTNALIDGIAATIVHTPDPDHDVITPESWRKIAAIADSQLVVLHPA